MHCPTTSDSGVELPIRPEAIAFDMDGTLLDYDGRLSDAVAKAVRIISKAGIKVFLITGRLQSGTVPTWRALELDTPIAACNGAHVGFPDKVPFHHVTLGEDARRKIIELELRHNLYVNYYIDDIVYAMHEGPERDWYSRQFSPVVKSPGLDDILSRRLPTKCVCIVPEADLQVYKQLFSDELGDEAHVTQSNTRFIEILPPHSDKGTGLLKLAEWAGISVEQCVAVGDAMNDLPMLEIAGFAISFKSADPRLAECVDMLLPPLWEDGIDILARCILGMTDSGRFLTSRSRRFEKK